MRRSLLTASLLGALCLTSSADRAWTADYWELPRFALHAKAVAKVNATCTTESPNAEGLPCYAYTTRWPKWMGTYVYIVVGQGPDAGVAGASFGIDYNPAIHALGYINFIQCADGDAFPNDGGNGDFPAADGGMRITWDTCQQQIIGLQGVHAVVGAIYMYSYGDDVMSITPNNNLSSGPELAVVTCPGVTIQIIDELAWDPSLVPLMLGRVGFGTEWGYTPCYPVPVLPTTWGKIKSRY